MDTYPPLVLRPRRLASSPPSVLYVSPMPISSSGDSNPSSAPSTRSQRETGPARELSEAVRLLVVGRRPNVFELPQSKIGAHTAAPVTSHCAVHAAGLPRRCHTAVDPITPRWIWRRGLRWRQPRTRRNCAGPLRGRARRRTSTNSPASSTTEGRD